MRQLATLVVTASLVGVTMPAMAETRTPAGQQTGQMRHGEQGEMVESHLKAAGYDVMQANQAIKSKDPKMVQEHLRSAQAHIRMAEGEMGTMPKGVASTDIRRISDTLGRIETTAGKDLSGAGRELTRLDNDLRSVIRRHETARSDRGPNQR